MTRPWPIGIAVCGLLPDPIASWDTHQLSTILGCPNSRLALKTVQAVFGLKLQFVDQRTVGRPIE
jgi:hypothetical protein